MPRSKAQQFTGDRLLQQPVPGYVAGSLLSITFTWLIYTFGNDLIFSLNTEFVYLALFISVLLITVVLSKYSRYLGFGFLAGVLTLIFWFILVLIELIIHPPSEE